MAQDLSIRAILTCQTQAFDSSMKRASRSAQEFSSTTRRAFGGMEGVAKKAFGAIGIGAQLAGDVFGAQSRIGRTAGAVGNVAGQAAIGGLTAGPVGAAIFGGIAALKEFKSALEESNKALMEAVAWRTRENKFAEEVQKKRTQDVRNQAFTFLHPERERTIETARQAVIDRQKQLTGLINSKDVVADRGELQKLRRERDDLRRISSGLGNLIGARDISKQIGEFIGQQTGRFSGGAFSVAERFGGIVAEPLGRGAKEAARLEKTRLDVLERTQMLMDRSASMMGAPLAIRGTNDYLRAISDKPKAQKDIGELVKTAIKQLEEEKKQTAALQRAIADRVTVSM